MKRLLLSSMLLLGAGVATTRADLSVGISIGHHNDHGYRAPVVVQTAPVVVLPPPLVVADTHLHRRHQPISHEVAHHREYAPYGGGHETPRHSSH